MTAFQKAEALAGQRFDRDKLLTVVPRKGLATHFRMPNSFEIEDAGSMSIPCAMLSIASVARPCNSAGTISRRGFGRSGSLASIVAAVRIGLGVHAF